jgi:hypothetical protein
MLTAIYIGRSVHFCFPCLFADSLPLHGEMHAIMPARILFQSIFYFPAKPAEAPTLSFWVYIKAQGDGVPRSEC